MASPFRTEIAGVQYHVEFFGLTAAAGGDMVTLFVVGRSGKPTSKARVGRYCNGVVIPGSWLPSGCGIRATA